MSSFRLHPLFGRGPLSREINCSHRGKSGHELCCECATQTASDSFQRIRCTSCQEAGGTGEGVQMEGRRFLTGATFCVFSGRALLCENALETPRSARLHRDAGGSPLKCSARVSYSRPSSVSRQLRRHPKWIPAIADLAFCVDPTASDGPTNPGVVGDRLIRSWQNEANPFQRWVIRNSRASESQLQRPATHVSHSPTARWGPNEIACWPCRS